MVAGMTSPQHAVTRTPSLAPAWAILLGMGAASITYNVVHAVHGGGFNIALALVYAITPVYGAALLSHQVAEHDGGKVMQAITFLLMLGAMALSIGATAAVLGPVAGSWMRWLFGVVADGAALVALRIILSDKSRKAKAAEVTETAHAQAAEVAAELARVRQERDTVQAELAEVRERLGGEVQALTSALNKARNKARSSGQKPRASSSRNTTVPDDVDTQAEALRILEEEPGISGGALGRRLGKSERYGCMLKNRLAPSG